MKRCPKCGIEKSLEDFGKNKARTSGINSYCRSCDMIRTKQWQKENKERASQNSLNCYYRHHDEYIVRGKEWRENNREKTLAMYKKYHENNPDKNREQQHERRAKIRGVFIEKVRRQLVFERDRGICHLCQLEVDSKNWHLDHIIPLSKGGLHCYNNVAVSHPSCNLAKNNKIDYFLQATSSVEEIKSIVAKESVAP